MTHYHKADCLVERLDCSVVVNVKVTKMVKDFSVPLDDISSAAEPCVSKFGMVMPRHGPVLFKKIGLLSSSSGVTVRAYLIRYDCFYHIC